MLRIEHQNWQSVASDIRQVRECVFVYERRIPSYIEFDSSDAQAEHVVLYEDQQPIATGRLCQDGYLSRVAVIPSKRKTDAAMRVFTRLTEIAKNKKLPQLTVATDLNHVNDLLSAGFTTKGCVYMEAGVARQKLCCPINQFSLTNWGWLH